MQVETKYKFAKVTDKIYNKFIDTGYVPNKIIRMLSLKLVNNIPLNEKELAIFYANTSAINDMIILVAKLINT